MFILLFFSTFVLINSHNINLCKKCKFFVPAFSLHLSKCKNFLRNKYYTNTTDYEYCFLAREIEGMCGKNGKRFIEKVEKDLFVEKDLLVEKDLFVEKVLSTIWEP